MTKLRADRPLSPILQRSFAALAAVLALLACNDDTPPRDSDGDGLTDAAEASRVRHTPFAAHVLVDEDPGPLSLLGGPRQVPDMIAMGDFDDDRYPDLITGWRDLYGFSTALYLHRNRLGEEAGDFAPAVALAVEAFMLLDLSLHDLDSDGDLDLTALNYLAVLPIPVNAADVVWLENRLDEAEADFAPLRTIQSIDIPDLPLPWVGFDRVFADLDGDSDEDLVWLGDGLLWRENRLDEAVPDFGPEQVIDVGLPSDGFDGQAKILAADLDGDDDLDVLFASSPDTIRWYENRLDEAAGDFSAARLVPTGGAGSRLLGVADMDVDRHPDLLVTTWREDLSPGCDDDLIPCQTSWIPNRLGDPLPGFDPPLHVVAEELAAMSFVDFDGDADPDFVTLRFDGLGVQMRAHQNRLSDTGDAFPTFDLGQDVRSPAGALPLHPDIDRDGDADIVLTMATEPWVGVVWLENPGTDPLDPDSDGDGHSDGEEESAGSDPNDAESVPTP